MQNLVITSAGQELMTSIIADGATASFTKIATSEHEYLQSELETLTSLEDIKQEVAISKLERKDESSIEILAGATNEELTEGYYVKALGLYSKDGEGNEILYAVAIDDTPDYLPAFNNTAISNIIYRLNVKVSNSAQVTLEIAQDTYATAIQAKELQEQIDAITEKKENYAQKDGSNATGTWGINITGNAKTATKLKTARSINGVNFDGSTDITLTPDDIGADKSGAADTALTNAKSYTDTKVANLVGSAPETLDTLEELSDALKDNADIVDVLNEAIATKANIDGSNAEGEWDIDITGNADTATKATQDGDGNVITSTYSKTGHTHNYAGSSSVGGAATSATKLATARTIQTNLASTATASFNGTANVKPGVTGTLPLENGGTGATTAEGAEYNVLGGMTEVADALGDSIRMVSAYTNPSSSKGRLYWRTALNVWNYMKSKIESVLGLTASQYSGNAATATKATTADSATSATTATSATSATKATQDASGNVITDTYALKSLYGDTAINIGRESGTTIGEWSTAEGRETIASGKGSHAEGLWTTASGEYAHAEGVSTIASSYASHAEGYYAIALTNQHADGHYNNTTTATESTAFGITSSGSAFVIGNGTSSARSNAFRVTDAGYVYAKSSTIGTGADYAEYFEWADENLNEEDRVGYFVTFDEDNAEKIRIANEGDYLLGIVSGLPNIIGNGDEDWKKRYILDDFGRYIEEQFEYEKETITGFTEEGEPIIEKEIKVGTKWKENPDYDKTKPYTPRELRSEWDAIGMLGVLSVYDDGTCQVNGYCKCANNGIATATEERSGYRVIKRVTDNIVKVVFR